MDFHIEGTAAKSPHLLKDAEISHSPSLVSKTSSATEASPRNEILLEETSLEESRLLVTAMTNQRTTVCVTTLRKSIRSIPSLGTVRTTSYTTMSLAQVTRAHLTTTTVDPNSLRYPR